jgi:4-amino-4-deoxy-L-arabinose transferase-like glycosyltransferase
MIPERSRGEWWIALALFAATCLYYAIFRSFTVLHGDEGIVLEGAQRILSGQVLYRDFFSFVTPGSYYWTAILFKIFGSSILVPRTVLVVYGGLFSIFLYFMARRVCSRSTAIFTVYLFTLTCLPYEFRALHNWDSAVWACAALYLAVRFVETPRGALALGVGAFASLACLFEQSKGAGLLLGLAIGFGLLVRAGRGRGNFQRRHLWAFLAGLTAPALITFAYFASQHALGVMLTDCLWPLHHYSAANRLPYGFPEFVSSELDKARLLPWGLQLGMVFILSPFFILPVLPILAAGLFAFWFFHFSQQKDTRGRAGYFVVVSATLVGLLISVLASGRPDVSHLIIFNGPFFLLVLAWSLEKSLLSSSFLNGARTLGSFYLFFSFTALGLTLLWRPLNAHTTIATRCGNLKAERADSIIQQIQARVPTGGRIYVFPYQPLYYYLTQTLNPTRFEYLQLGMHTPEQFEEAARELAASRVPVVVFQPSFPEFIPHAWPATPLSILGEKDKVTEFIITHYRSCDTLASVQNWRLVFMVRNDLHCGGPF